VSAVRDGLAELLHDHGCTSAVRCGRYQRPGSAHRDFYELRAQNVIAKLEPEIGLANVIIVVRAVLEELD
jgi:hypothetical protein